MIPREVDSQSEQPRAETPRGIELLQAFEGAKERFLGEVAYGFAVEHEPLDDLHHATFVSLHELSESVVVALPRQMNKPCLSEDMICRGSILVGEVDVEGVRFGHTNHARSPFRGQIRTTGSQRWSNFYEATRDLPIIAGRLMNSQRKTSEFAERSDVQRDPGRGRE